MFLKSLSLVALSLASAALAPVAVGAEGGSSEYLQGTYNDFEVAITAPPGLYMRNDVFYYDASAGAHPLGGEVNLGSTVTLWVDMLKVEYMSDIKILGGTYGAAAGVPFIADATVTAAAGSGAVSAAQRASVSGISDTFVLPFELFWTRGDQHFALTPAFIVPTGSYDKNAAITTGRNYWSFDFAGAYTWFDQQRGNEVSFTTGVLFNSRNGATEYRTGDEFHLDWTVAKHFSERFAVGLTGYWYDQLSPDSGTLPGGYDASSFASKGVGIGVAALYTMAVGSKSLNLIAKWIDDLSCTNRFKGDILMLSIELGL